MELDKKQKQKIKEIAEKYHLADVYVFGSKISGFEHPGSDFDIGVRFMNKIPDASKRGKIYGDLFSDLTTCFKKEKIDLVFMEEIPLHIQFEVVSKGELIYARSLDNSYNFMEKVINFYRDYKYFIDEYFQGRLESAKS